MFEMFERGAKENGGLGRPHSTPPGERLAKSCRITANSCPGAAPTAAAAAAPVSGVPAASRDQHSFERCFLRMLDRVHRTIEKSEFRLAEQERRDAIKREWQLVALVVDRVLLVVFTIATLSITAAILLHAPHSAEFIFGGGAAPGSGVVTNHSLGGATADRKSNDSLEGDD